MKSISKRATAPLSLSFLVFAGCYGGGHDVGDETAAGEARPGEASLVFASDRSFIFERAGDQAQLDVEVVRDGRAVPRAEIQFRSSDPSVVTVDEHGVVEAVAEEGSAMITVEAEGVAPATANAVIAELTPQVRRIPSEQLVEVDRELAHATIQMRNAAPLAVGDILLSGDRGGLFARVTDVWSISDDASVVAYDRNVAVTDAFENLSLRAHTEMFAFDDELHAAILDRLTCVDETDALVEFTGPELKPLLSSRIHFDYEIRGRRVQLAELYVSGNLGLEASAGELRIEGKFGGAFRCQVALPDITVPPIPVLGPVVGLGGVVKSRVGLQGGAYFEYASLNYQGPSVVQELEAKAGVRVTRDDGISPIGHVETVRDEVVPGEGIGSLFEEGGFQLEFGPFLEATFTVRIGIGPIGVDIDLVSAEASGGLDARLEPPFDPYVAGYRGPRWELFWASDVNLHPILSSVSSFLSFFERRLGVVVGDSIYDLDPALWNGRWALAGSPRAEVITDREEIAVNEEVAISAEGLGSYDGGVEYLLHHCGKGQGQSVAELPAGEPAVYRPSSDGDRGSHELGMLLWDSALGRIGLPYAAVASRALRVGDNPDQRCR